MLRIENLGIRFEQTEILSNMNLHVKKGELICITGPSGCGKTTLLRAVMGFVSPYKGSITVDDTLLTSRTVEHIRHKIGWMPQGLSLPYEWVREMVHLPLDLKVNRGTPFDEKLLLEYFEALGLEENLLDKRLHEISGGQYQRIQLAITAMQEKPLLIIDEPTSALDKASTQKTIQFIQRLADKGKSILTVSHTPQFMEGCHRVVKM
jgi:putative ABC transport system ATP-binding protein